jgi:hypothetical protein
MTKVSLNSSRVQTAVFKLVAVTIGVCVSLAAAEVTLRTAGISPWTDAIDPSKRTQPLYEPDLELGWRNRPANIALAARPGGEPLRWTFLADGTRSTAPEGHPGRPVVALVGCSFTQGIGLSDRETYAWNLQLKRPELAIRNYGTGGYGTYQSLLVLERLFASLRSPRPDLVLYGFIEHHEIRNVAAPEWTRLLASTSSVGRVDLPYCSIDADGSLRRHDPEHYPIFPLMRYSSIANQLQQTFIDLVTDPRRSRRRQVTERLLAAMDDTCRSNGVAFAVLLLHASQEVAAHYREFCTSEGIACFDIVSPMTADLRLPNDNHPNAKQNLIWAERIDQLIEAKLLVAQPGRRGVAPESRARVASGHKAGPGAGTVR